uniref:Mitochondrial carrier protein n=1 Tax=Alexandrium monilatum TaxID=311494 RepID=A0A7S4TAE5_9DINO
MGSRHARRSPAPPPLPQPPSTARGASVGTPPAMSGPAVAEDEEDMFEWEVRDSSTPFGQHAIAGSVAGVMEHLSMYPLDTVKTRMQASPERLSVGGAVDAVLRERGLRGLMRGSTVVGAGCVPAHVGFFVAYELASAELLAPGREEHQPMRAAACGAAATLVHDLILTPHDVVKQRLQLGRHAGPLDCISSMWQRDGARGLYRSLPITLAMSVPYTGLLVAANDSLKRAWRLERNGADASLSVAHRYFVCAGLSGAFAAAATLPLDVLKTRIQTQACQTGADFPRAAAAPKHGILSVAQGILRTEGLRGFFRGLLPRVLLSAPSAGISWGTYETVRMALCSLEGRREHASRSCLPELCAIDPSRQPPALVGRAELAA